MKKLSGQLVERHLASFKNPGCMPLPVIFRCVAALMLLVVMGYPGAAAQTGHSIDGILDATTLTFDITIQNPSDQAAVVTKVGALIDPVSGSFHCLAEPSVLLPIGNYVVQFHLTERKPIRTIDPVSVPPRGVLRLKISLEPDATGACGFWAAKVRAVVVFADGSNLTTAKQETITSSDVGAAASRPSQRAELMDSLQSSDSKIREYAVRRLMAEPLSHEALIPLLRHKLHDPCESVRVTAADAIANLHLDILGPDVSALLTSEISPEELKHYVGAVSLLREPSAVPVLTALLGQKNDMSTEVLQTGLLNIGTPSVPNSVRPLLVSKKNWSSPEASEADAHRYFAIVAILVFYRDDKSIPLLSSLLTTTTHRAIQLGLMAALLRNTRDETLIQDPFLLSMGPAAAIVASEGDNDERDLAITLIRRFPPTQARSMLTWPILEAAIKSSDSKLRVTAAKAAAALSYSTAVPAVCAAWVATSDSQERVAFENIAQALGGHCK